MRLPPRKGRARQEQGLLEGSQSVFENGGWGEERFGVVVSFLVVLVIGTGVFTFVTSAGSSLQNVHAEVL